MPGTSTPKQRLYEHRAVVERTLFASELALIDAVRRQPPLDIAIRAALARRPPADRRRGRRRPRRRGTGARRVAPPGRPPARPPADQAVPDAGPGRRRRPDEDGPPQHVDAGDHAAEPLRPHVEGHLRRGTDAAGRRAGDVPDVARQPSAARGGPHLRRRQAGRQHARQLRRVPEGELAGQRLDLGTGRLGQPARRGADRAARPSAGWDPREPPGAVATGRRAVRHRLRGRVAGRAGRGAGDRRAAQAVVARRAGAATGAVAAPPAARRLHHEPQRGALEPAFGGGAAAPPGARRPAGRGDGTARRGRGARPVGDVRHRSRDGRRHPRTGAAAHRDAVGQGGLRRAPAGADVRRSGAGSGVAGGCPGASPAPRRCARPGRTVAIAPDRARCRVRGRRAEEAIALLSMATVAVAVGWWGVDLVGWGWPRYVVPGVPAVVLAGAGVAWMATVEHGRRVGLGLLAAAAGFVVLPVLIDRLPADSWVRWPGWIWLSGVVFAAVGTAWMRPFHRVVAVVIAAVVYTGVACWHSGRGARRLGRSGRSSGRSPPAGGRCCASR